ncbi:hypothetical protein AVEN_58597-1 [Araneus ventricosus]|uniref:Uncharacterized protein n=1 Tax=Araneus ventricosus TaxID=182803 RepID=A0A4Y2WKJ4_ARAVE|nr:hypothetical protein AVEN_96329-1 [Araneus ventricosus]GBO37172.1 hypothetical protein AVEN_58597-1 [Araneus ventricosus]
MGKVYELGPLLRALRKGRNLQGREAQYTIEDVCILYGERVCIPKQHQKNVLDELHIGHLGMHAETAENLSSQVPQEEQSSSSTSAVPSTDVPVQDSPPSDVQPDSSSMSPPVTTSPRQVPRLTEESDVLRRDLIFKKGGDVVSKACTT